MRYGVRLRVLVALGWLALWAVGALEPPLDRAGGLLETWR